MERETDATVSLDGLAERLADQDLSLGVFTDEELAAVDLPPHPEGPTGWFASLDGAGREVARTAATRSLAARGLLRPGGQGDRLEVHPTLVLLRSCRRDALAVTLVDRHGPGGHERALYHLVAEGIVLEELLDADGLHACTLRSLGRASASLAARCDPDAVARPTRQIDVDGSAPAQLAADDVGRLLDRAAWRTELATVRRTDRRPGSARLVQAALTLAATDDGVWAVSAGSATDPAAPVPVTGVAATQLPAVLGAILDPPVADERSA